MSKQSSLQLVAGPLASEFDRQLRKGAKGNLAGRIMKRDASVYGSTAAIRKLVANRLGWTDIASTMRKRIPEIEKFGKKAIADGIRHVVLVGMGGSSLCPEVMTMLFGKRAKLASFDVLDSTDPVAVGRLAARINLRKALFIIASKSGGTIETRSHEAFFLDLYGREGIKKPGTHFAAITDKGSDLEKFALRMKYRKVFRNPSDIGGRYSALSYFGLVPAFFAGVKLGAFLDEAIRMEKLLGERADESNPALILGAIMAAGAKAGRNKLTFVASKGMAPVVPWIEQLVAESTGKKGKGVVPIEGEPMLKPAEYGKDRLFVALRLATERGAKFAPLVKHHPVVELVVGERSQIGAQFLLWEAATAVAGQLMGINPFDEPNVTESKEATKRILAGFQKSGYFPYDHDAATERDLEKKVLAILKKQLRSARPPKYVAFLCYFTADAKSEKQLSALRGSIAAKTKGATLRGYGPRYLHSIGQLYKGGPKDGLFVILLRDEYAELPIAGQKFGFGELIKAQGLGDAQALMKRKLPTLLLAVEGDPSLGLQSLVKLTRKALA
jgi:glucose-6-phosphate isomerase